MTIREKVLIVEDEKSIAHFIFHHSFLQRL